MSTSTDTHTTPVLPSLPEHPVDAPSKCPSGPIYQVPQDHEPTEGWWAKKATYGVEIFEGPYKRGFLYFEIPQGRLDTFLQVGLELRVPYITLWDLVQVLSWSVIPIDDDLHSWMNAVVRRIENHGSRFAYSNQKEELFYMTRKVFAERLDRCDVRGAAQEAILKETAHLRHSARVQATVDVALDHVREVLVPTIGPMKDQEKRLVAATLILADIMGVGGTDDVKGDSTLRMQPFNQLGKGRKQASDGSAYMAAAECAFHQIFDDISQIHFHIEATPKTLVARVDGWDAVVLIDSDIVPLRWLRTIVREGLRRSLGMPAWFDDLPYEVRFPGYSEDWAAAVNRIEAEIEVDSLTVDAEVFSVTDRTDDVVVRIKTIKLERGEPKMVSVRFVRNASGELALDDDWFESSYKRLGVYYDRLVRLYTDLANGRHQEPTKAEEPGSW